MADENTIIEPIRAAPSRAAVLCDIDGTLAPIVSDPADATVPHETRAVLRALSERYALVACVSGRRASAARRMVGLEELTYAGNHGLELLEPGEVEPRLDPALGHRGAAAAGFVARLDWRDHATLGLRVEDKGPIQAIHWRGAPDPESAEGRAREIGALAEREGLVAHFGRMVLELRPVATVHKGVAARRLVVESGASAALFGGDDRTDLDAFEALRELAGSREIELAVCVGIASPEGPAEIQREADLVVGGPDGFADLLRALL